MFGWSLWLQTNSLIIRSLPVATVSLNITGFPAEVMREIYTLVSGSTQAIALTALLYRMKIRPNSGKPVSEYMGAPTTNIIIAEERGVEWWSDTVSHTHPSPLRSGAAIEKPKYSPNWERRRRRYCNVTGLAYLFTIGSNIWNCLKISHHINLFTCNVSTQHTSLTYPSNRNQVGIRETWWWHIEICSKT